MSLFVYVSKVCKDHIKNGAGYLQADLKKFESRIQKSQCVEMFDQTRQPYLLKVCGGAERWIARKYPICVDGEDHEVVIFLDVLHRDSQEYKSTTTGFGHDPVAYGKRKLEPIAEELLNGPDKVIEKYIRGKISEGKAIVRKRRLTEEEIHFLTVPMVRREDKDVAEKDVKKRDIFIFESRRWTEYVRRDDKLTWLPRIREAVAGVCEIDFEESDVGVARTYEIAEHEHNYIAYQWLPQVAGHLALFVYDIYADPDSPVGEVPVDKIAESDKPFFRMYPNYMLWDEDFWIQLERDPVGNFFLSAEENKILHGNEQAGTCFPLFINGRAGSGKSTILQYLYAEYFARWARAGFCEDRPPVYFACNKELVERAKETVASILGLNPNYCENSSLHKYVKFEEKGKTKVPVISAPEFDNSFCEFRQFLLSLIPEEDKKKIFPSGGYVDYARFVKLWNRRYGHEKDAQEKYGPDVSWHVIRTFIKGQYYDEYMEPSEYEELSRVRRSVSDRTYQVVFEKVWTDWYLGGRDEDENKVWDDQDLVRYVLKEGLISRSTKFYGVFCDESQDFTRVELEAILHLSAFSERTVYPYQLPLIPFVFAGDEFQTLNPTGFKWDSIRAYFTEKFILGLSTTSGGKTMSERNTKGLITKELEKNYRSQANIVRFNNAIQMLRCAMFDDAGQCPQLAWQWMDDLLKKVTYFDENDKEFWRGIRAFKEVCVILPCHRGDEFDYVMDDCNEVLRRQLKVDVTHRTTTPPVLSAVQAKGLDYSCVVVYGFGKFLAKMNRDAVTSASKMGPDEKIALEYFMNRLYVSVSRPKRQLFIVDSEEGRRCLWKYISDDKSIEQFVNGDSRLAKWRSHVGGWRKGSSVDLKPDDGGVDLLQLAADYRTNGERDHDAQMMEYAAYYFQQCDKQTEANDCAARAWMYAAESERDVNDRNAAYESAAEKFAENGNALDAGDCYWMMKTLTGYEQMSRLAGEFRDVGAHMKFKIAAAISGKNVSALQEVVRALAERISSHSAYEFSSAEWKHAISTMFATMPTPPEDVCADLLSSVYVIAKANLVAMPDRAARIFGDLAFLRGSFGEAAAIYAAGKLQTTSNYRKAMFVSQPYPNKLVHFDRSSIDEAHEIIRLRESEANIGKQLEPTQKRNLFAAYAVAGELPRVSGELVALREAETYESISKVAGDAPGRMLHQASVLMRVLRMKHSEALNYVFGSPESRTDARLDSHFKMRLLARIVDLGASPNPPIQAAREGRDAFITSYAQALFSMMDSSIRSDREELDKIFLQEYINPRDLKCYKRRLKAASPTGMEPVLTMPQRVDPDGEKLLHDILNVRTLARREDGQFAAVKGVFVAKHGGVVAESHNANETAVALPDEADRAENETHVVAPNEKVDVKEVSTVVGKTSLTIPLFSSVPKMSYSHDRKRLNVGVDDLGLRESWHVNFKGVFADDVSKGTRLQITQTMFVETDGRMIMLKDTLTGLDIVIK